MKHTYFISLTIGFFLCIFSCKKSDLLNQQPNDDSTNSDAIEVFLIGKGHGESADPILWTNWMPGNLQGIKGGEAASLFVSGNIYVGGRSWTDYAQTKFAPCYWVSGNRKDLPLLDSRGVGMVEGIANIGGNTLCAGTASDSLEFHANNGWRYLPTLWKGTAEVIALDRLDNFGGGFAHCLSWVSGGNMTGAFIGGSSKGASGYNEPCYWAYGLGGTEELNKKAYPLPSLGYGGSAEAVWTYLNANHQGNVKNTDFYFAGYVDKEDDGALINTPCCWYKGNRIDLSTPYPNENAMATAITHYGVPPVGTTYVAGNILHSGVSLPCIWENQTRTDLPVIDKNNGGGEARSIKVINGDVFVGGFVYDSHGNPHPCYWKNGELKYNDAILGTVRSMDIALK